MLRMLLVGRMMGHKHDAHGAEMEGELMLKRLGDEVSIETGPLHSQMLLLSHDESAVYRPSSSTVRHVDGSFP